MAPVELLRDPAVADAALEVARTHALLLAVGAGRRPAAIRVLVPPPTVAFGRLDAANPGFAEACAAARAHGFTPVVRLAGGHAAAYDEGSFVLEEVRPHAAPDAAGRPLDLEPRYARASGLVREALTSLGVPAEVGELPGEYCPGAHSVHAGGRKVAGIAQRVTKDAALTSTVLVVADGLRVRAAIAAVYAALHIDIDPGLTGAVADSAPQIGLPDVAAALIRGCAEREPLVAGTLDGDGDLLEAAQALLGRHTVTA